MKCTKCGYNSFDYLDSCKKCGSLLVPKKIRYESDPLETSFINGSAILDEVDTNKVDFDQPEVFSQEVLLEEPSISEPPAKNLGYAGSGVELYSVVNKENNVDFYLTLASAKQRVIAFIIDLILVCTVGLFTLLFGLINLDFNYINKISMFSYIFLPVYIMLIFLLTSYFIFLHGYAGKTIGKLYMGLSVVKEDGTKINFSDSFIRWIGYFLSFLPVFYGFISALSDKKMQAWHDRLAKTIVVEN